MDSDGFFGNYCSLWSGNWLIYLTKWVNTGIYGSLVLCQTSYRYPWLRYQMSVYRTNDLLFFYFFFTCFGLFNQELNKKQGSIIRFLSVQVTNRL